MSFGNFNDSYNRTDSRIVILPVPFDKTTTWQKGTNRGPQAILEASPNLEFYDIETGTEVFRKGIFTEKPVNAANSETMVNRVFNEVESILEQDKFPVIIGGEHSVAIGAVRAFDSIFKRFSVLQLDAHADLRDSYMGSTLNHACVMARVLEMCPITQVGIRSMDVSEKENLNKVRTFFAHEIHQQDDWIQQAVDTLEERVYVTIDLDVFDPGIMPSTGTPEPGGLGWYQVMKLLDRVAAQRIVIGFDVVELSPGTNKAPDFLAAKLIYQFLSYIWR